MGRRGNGVGMTENEIGTIVVESAIAVHCATLGGTGTVLSTNVTFASTAVLAPGGTNRVGTLTFGGNVALASGFVYRAKHTDAGSNTVVVAGTLTLPETASVSLSVVGIPLPKRFTLFTAGALAGATQLRDWQVSGVEPDKYLVSREGATQVVATLLARGTLIRLQ